MQTRCYYIALSNAHLFTSMSYGWHAEAYKQNGDSELETICRDNEFNYKKQSEDYDKLAKEVIR